MHVRVNLRASWQSISVAKRQGERITIYRHGHDEERCFLICRNGLRREDILKQVVEADLELDNGGAVVTVHHLVDETTPHMPLRLALSKLRRGKL
jgi:hypothetical protein